MLAYLVRHLRHTKNEESTAISMCFKMASCSAEIAGILSLAVYKHR